MNILLACPAPVSSRSGNRVTAERWARLLREAGHRARVVDEWEGQPCDVLVALHARKSYASVRRWRQQPRSRPLVVAMTGTDLYRDLPQSQQAQRSVMWADRLVVLHPLALQSLPDHARAKTRVILQSVEPLPSRPVKHTGTFDVCVLGHLRYVKDPLRTAYALRTLCDLPQVRVIQAGEATTAGWANRARAAMARDPRYRWLGPITRAAAMKLLAASRLMVISSRMEGGANVVGEATVNDVPILASRVPGNLGLLDAGHPGIFEVGDTRALADLLAQAITDARFLGRLTECGRRCKSWFEPARERSSWNQLIAEL
jgi:putative glycosyltransferase (TIGR04348 family)